jgi:hypothetical protein
VRANLRRRNDTQESWPTRKGRASRHLAIRSVRSIWSWKRRNVRSVPTIGKIPPDPIFAAIDEYKAALAARSATLNATWDGGGEALADLPRDAPECIAADAAHDEALDREWDTLDALLTTTPTTIAGVAALLDQLAIYPYQEEEGPDSDWGIVIEWALECRGDRRNKVIDCMTSLASALRAMSGAGRLETA